MKEKTVNEELYAMVAAETSPCVIGCPGGPWVPGRRQSYVALAGGHDVNGCWHDVFRWEAVLVAVFGNPKRKWVLVYFFQGTLHSIINRSKGSDSWTGSLHSGNHTGYRIAVSWSGATYANGCG